MSNYDVEQIYQDFWKDIICVGNGIIDIEQVKNELCDDYLSDDWDFITAECKTNADYKKAIFDYLQIEK